MKTLQQKTALCLSLVILCLLISPLSALGISQQEIDALAARQESLRQQRAGGIALAAAEMIRRGQLQDAAYVVPNYLRLSQAERERLARLAAQPEPNS